VQYLDLDRTSLRGWLALALEMRLSSLQLHPTLVVLESALAGCMVTMAPRSLEVPWDAQY
jgi:hypothetical protein